MWCRSIAGWSGCVASNCLVETHLALARADNICRPTRRPTLSIDFIQWRGRLTIGSATAIVADRDANLTWRLKDGRTSPTVDSEQVPGLRTGLFSSCRFLRMSDDKIHRLCLIQDNRRASAVYSRLMKSQSTVATILTLINVDLTSSVAVKQESSCNVAAVNNNDINNDDSI